MALLSRFARHPIRLHALQLGLALPPRLGSYFGGAVDEFLSKSGGVALPLFVRLIALKMKVNFLG